MTSIVNDRGTDMLLKRKRGFFSRLGSQWQLVLMSVPMLLYVFLFNYAPLYGWINAFRDISNQAKTAMPYLNGEKSLDEAVESLKQSTRRYAKRQLTWFRRHDEAERLYIDKYGSYQSFVDDAVNIIENKMKGNGDE